MEGLTKRIIPCLDVDCGKVVKGVNFNGLRVMGDPVALAKKYNQEGADELAFLDISASVEARDVTLEVVESVAKEVFIPLIVGGGISKLEHINRLLHIGVDKVSLNSAAVRKPEFITDGAKKFGSQCIVVAIDTKKTRKTKSGWSVFIKGGREDTQKDLGEWVKEVCDRGAGEILLTSMDCDGVKRGFDIECLKFVNQIADIPIIASGGAGKKEDFLEIFKKDSRGKSIADAGLAASIFHNDEVGIQDLKQYLFSQHIQVRI